MSLEQIFKQAADNIAARLYVQLLEATKQEEQLLADVLAEHSSMPEHYWEPREKARRLYETAKRVADALG